MSDVKQVLVWRKDIVCRKGKVMAQISHASIAFLTRRLQDNGKDEFLCKLSKAEQEWLNNSFKKITLQVENEQELLDIYQKAQSAGLIVEIIRDSGHTEFHGVPTLTCLAIGPDESNKIDPITGHLKLY